MCINQFHFGKKINSLEIFNQTNNNLLRIVVPPSSSIKLIQNIENKFKYYIDWCGSLFWVEVPSTKNDKIKEIKKITKEIGGYLTIIKKSEEFDFEETIFTVNETRLLISEKIKKALIQKEYLIQERCIEEFNAIKFFKKSIKRC